jgi:hypothetical protein
LLICPVKNPRESGEYAIIRIFSSEHV